MKTKGWDSTVSTFNLKAVEKKSVKDIHENLVVSGNYAESGHSATSSYINTNTLVDKRLSAHDVARYILEKTGTITTMKLQKLLYYCQAWSLVWDEKPLFKENIEAWANGPVIREIYNNHKGRFKVSSWELGSVSKINQTQKETIDGVLDFYGQRSSQWLSDLTHNEAPWQEARKGLSDEERGSNIISLASMNEYYSSL